MLWLAALLLIGACSAQDGSSLAEQLLRAQLLQQAGQGVAPIQQDANSQQQQLAQLLAQQQGQQQPGQFDNGNQQQLAQLLAQAQGQQQQPQLPTGGLNEQQLAQLLAQAQGQQQPQLPQLPRVNVSASPEEQLQQAVRAQLLQQFSANPPTGVDVNAPAPPPTNDQLPQQALIQQLLLQQQQQQPAGQNPLQQLLLAQLQQQQQGGATGFQSDPSVVTQLVNQGQTQPQGVPDFVNNPELLSPGAIPSQPLELRRARSTNNFDLWLDVKDGCSKELCKAVCEHNPTGRSFGEVGQVQCPSTAICFCRFKRVGADDDGSSDSGEIGASELSERSPFTGETAELVTTTTQEPLSDAVRQSAEQQQQLIRQLTGRELTQEDVIKTLKQTRPEMFHQGADNTPSTSSSNQGLLKAQRSISQQRKGDALDKVQAQSDAEVDTTDALDNQQEQSADDKH